MLFFFVDDVFAFFFVVAVVPKVTVPLVATSFAAGDMEGARARTCDSLFVAGVMRNYVCDAPLATWLFGGSSSITRGA